MVETAWFKVPSDIKLSSREGWESLGKNRYQAVINHFLLVKQRESKTKNGSILMELQLPAGSEMKFEEKLVLVKKYTDTITANIQKSITNKLSSETSTKIGIDLGLLPTSQKITQAIQSKINTELTEALTAGLSNTKSYEVTITQERTTTLTLTAPEGGIQGVSTFYFYHKLWPWRWDLYLYKEETIEVVYRKRWFGEHIRQKSESKSRSLREPITRIVFYEPEDNYSISQESFAPDVLDSAVIAVELLDEPCPIDGDGLLSLEVVPLAFPVTEHEKNFSHKVKDKINKQKTQAIEAVASRIIQLIEQSSTLLKLPDLLGNILRWLSSLKR